MFSRMTYRMKRRLLRRFIKDHEGTAAIEFAIVALPFFAILFAILETAIIFFAGQLLETGLSDAARLVRTGQAQNNDFNVSDFKDAVCENVFALLECDTGLRIDVRELDSFGGATMPPPVDDNGDFDDSGEIDPNDPGSTARSSSTSRAMAATSFWSGRSTNGPRWCLTWARRRATWQTATICCRRQRLFATNRSEAST